MLEHQHDKLREYYRQYMEVVRPLIMFYEVMEEKAPISVYNEIRAFNDHIATVYHYEAKEDDENKINSEINKVHSHLLRLTLDGYKYVNSAFANKIKSFEEQVKFINYTQISDGAFYIPYKELYNNWKAKILEAKKEENIRKQ